MKKILSEITKASGTDIPFDSPYKKGVIEGSITLSYFYFCSIWYPRDFIESHKRYVDSLFIITDFLYEHYELGKVYFETLDHAATRLEQLSLAQIKDSPAEEAHKVKESLADYLDKAAMIFQTAADKTERETETDTEFYRGVYNAKAREYSAKADSYRGILRFNYAEKMRDLYGKAAAECKIGFIQVLLQRRADEYREKCAVETAAQGTSSFFNQKPGGTDDHESLLRHRTVPGSGNE